MSGLDELPNAIEVRSLVKRFGELTAVDRLDLSVPPGQVVALLGPNGAGKSTLTEMILGLTRPTSGVVRVFGQPPSKAVRDNTVGAMLQNGVLLSGSTVRGLLTSMRGLYAHPLSIDEVVQRADLSSFLGTRTDKLSGGQRQRVRFALAMIADPALILLDEPTVGLDVEARRRFWSTMHDFAGDGRTVLFATHYLDEADEFADRVVVMAAGSIVADGSGAQIKSVVAGRVVSFASQQQAAWDELPGVSDVSREGSRIVLSCTDSDATLRALLGHDVHDIEVTTPSLEDAFLRITHSNQTLREAA